MQPSTRRRIQQFYNNARILLLGTLLAALYIALHNL